MEECFGCCVSGNKVRLFDAISDGGIVKVCEKCSLEKDIPIIRRPTTFQLKEAERKKTIYERLSKSSGIKKEDKVDSELLRKQETTLRDLVDKNFNKRVEKGARPRPDLIDNFHWVIMRARRMKKLTQEQLAKEIGESGAAIKMAEQGVLPEDDYRLVDKLEKYLGVNLVRKEFVEEIKKPEKEVIFDSMKSLTIADLKEIKEEREKKGLEEEEFSGEEETEEKADLSEEEIRDLIFKKGRKE